ncbi:MarR family winged helix-turn-helix transcriptional regulator [Croceicoccus sp. YJ47]|uniref:MarR family winged helix-turn-helix transcriptional regulator n=1 Tax=Croceicoccus sp. YJ47 TaxID=2798724 RepID=UPI0019244262|nr:MarR family transcriptional regulator [Croceicoccus sp. YJ47]QQN75288.1 MarR family transcriptional regulator [Croceicoccus sp. YJ47]
MPEEHPFRLGFLVHDVSRLRRTIIDKALKPMGITRSQWWVLSNLARHQNLEMKQTELANVLDIGKVALGGLLDRLEAAGHIKRLADPVDRRAKRIVMTAQGKRILTKMTSRGKKLNDAIYCDLTNEEITFAEEILSKMKQRLIAMDNAVKSGKAPEEGVGPIENITETSSEAA